MSESESLPTGGREGVSDARERYRDALQQIDGELARATALDARFGKVRVVCFLAAAALWLLGFYAESAGPFRIAAVVATIAFLGVVIANEPVRDRLEALRRRRSVVRRLVARLERSWKELQDESQLDLLQDLGLTELQLAAARDLDLFGTSSLYRLVSMAGTSPGIKTLARWMTGPATATVAADRATAARSLAPRFEDRLRFYSLAVEVGRSTGDPRRFVEWASGPPWLASRSWLPVWANVSATLAVLLLLCLFSGALGLHPAGWKLPLIGLLGLGILNVLLTAVVFGPAHQIFSIAMSSRHAVDAYRELFAAARWLPSQAEEAGPQPGSAEASSVGKPARTPSLAIAESGIIEQIRHTLLSGDKNAIEGMQSLAKVARAGGLRQSAATFLIYLPLQAFALWDVRVLKRLESWQATYGGRTVAWFSALGELEAVLSVAALWDEYPAWAAPQWQSDRNDALLSAISLGHPLIPDRSRVCNDVSIGPPGTFLLVTGSNMSGKSTMLRSIGLNVVLAGIGAPVCARSFRLPSLELATSIRVSDDLSQGVSFYMAELHRLKGVVDEAERLSSSPDHVLLFLLDEILQGTNSRERQIAVVQVLRTLADHRAIGAITTHDLELADEPELKAAAQIVHFRETIEIDADGTERMTFDYRMREGVSPTTNALRLLEIVGLGKAKARAK